MGYTCKGCGHQTKCLRGRLEGRKWAWICDKCFFKAIKESQDKDKEARKKK